MAHSYQARRTGVNCESCLFLFQMKRSFIKYLLDLVIVALEVGLKQLLELGPLYWVFAAVIALSLIAFIHFGWLDFFPRLLLNMWVRHKSGIIRSVACLFLGSAVGLVVCIWWSPEDGLAIDEMLQKSGIRPTEESVYFIEKTAGINLIDDMKYVDFYVWVLNCWPSDVMFGESITGLIKLAGKPLIGNFKVIEKPRGPIAYLKRGRVIIRQRLEPEEANLITEFIESDRYPSFQFDDLDLSIRFLASGQSMDIKVPSINQRADIRL